MAVPLFPDAKRAENLTQDLFDVRFADDLTNRIERRTEIDRNELGRLTCFQLLSRVLQESARIDKAGFVPRVDRDG